MSTALEDRLAELEVRLAFVDDLVASLNDTVAMHDRRLHDLHQAMERMRSELAAARDALSHDVHDEPPPPHY